MKEVKLLSGVFSVKPKELLTLNAGGMIRLSPKMTYQAFRSNYEIKNHPGEPTIMIIKDGYRWFPVIITYAKNNFDFLSDKGVANQADWIENFNLINEHIRTGDKIHVKI